MVSSEDTRILDFRDGSVKTTVLEDLLILKNDFGRRKVYFMLSIEEELVCSRLECLLCSILFCIV